jgi:hypothetical protein
MDLTGHPSTLKLGLDCPINLQNGAYYIIDAHFTKIAKKQPLNGYCESFKYEEGKSELSL